MSATTAIHDADLTDQEIARLLNSVPRTRRSRGTAFLFSSALAAVTAVTTAIAVFFPGVFRDTAMTAGNARGTALVLLVIALPALLAGMTLARHRVLWGRVLWLGALAYITYNAVFFAYAVHFNRLFLLNVAMLSLGVWSIVSLVREIQPLSFQARLAGRLPVGFIAGYLLITTALFTLLWLKDILPAVIGGMAPVSLERSGMVTNAIEMTDLAFGFPLTALAAVWLWQRRAWGYVLAGVFLVYGLLESISVATDQFFGHLSDPQQPLSAIPIFIVLALIGLLPTALYLRGFRRSTQEEGV